MWIRWKTKASVPMSLWHRAAPGHAIVRVRAERVPLVEVVGETPPSGFVARRIYRRTACGFAVPPLERIEEHPDDPPPVGPRCIWCVHGWVVDVSPAGGGPPAQSGPSGAIRIPAKKRPPTLHA